jgi:antitoxin component YwqK of YwqJK toxin-antitoxin module
LEQEVEWQNGLQQGKEISWYENGQVSEETYYHQGKADGISKTWAKNGDMILELLLKNGNVSKRIDYHKGKALPVGLLAAKKNLKTIYESLVTNSQFSFPMTDDVKSSADFAIWYRKKTNDTRPELWFLPDDEKVRDLIEDESGGGIPSQIPSEFGELDDVKDAIGYSVAIPGDDAESRKFNRNLKSGAYPIIWTRGLESGSDKWDVDSPWAGEDGLVLFSDGTIRHYDDTKGQDGNGVFKTAINKFDEADKKSESTYDIYDALPVGWLDTQRLRKLN